MFPSSKIGRRRRPAAPRALMILLAALAPAQNAQTAEGLTLDIARLEGAGWHAEGIALRLLADAGSPAASIHVDKLVLPPPVGEITELTFRCDDLYVSATIYGCERGRARLIDSPLDDRPFPIRMRYERSTGRFFVATPGISWQGLEVSLGVRWSTAGWRANVGVADADAATLYDAMRTLGDGLPEIEISAGRIDLLAELRTGVADRMDITGNAVVHDFDSTNDEGTFATDGLETAVEFDASFVAEEDWTDYRVSVAATDGEAYLEPAYLNLAATPFRLAAAGRLDEAEGRIVVSSFDLQHDQVVTAVGNAQLGYGETPGLEILNLAIRRAQFPRFYDTYLQGFLTGTPFAKLETAGELSGNVSLADRELIGIDLRLEDVSFDDRERRLALYGARGRIAWRRDPDSAPLESRLSWDGGFVYSIGFGSAEALWQADADSASLQGTLRVPVADGALNVETFRARGLTGGTPNVTFDARLEPVSLARITTALGWPALRGKLSGELPLLSLSEGEVAIGGDLTARVFDGKVRIADLRIERPFGAARRTTADVELDDLDLGIVTDVFSFGRIEGRLDGSVRGLSMLQGRPIAFDASFYTPVDDDSRHLISRRALNNISEIAGAGTALLSGGFLSLFQEFRYDTLGINCVLEGDVCRMSGVRPAPSGYYLVKGSGLPRIDVIGHSREVNWPRLVAQIAEALRAREVSTTPQSEEQR